MSEQTLNIPQLIAVLLITFFALRWYFSSSSPDSGSGSGSSSSTSSTSSSTSRGLSRHNRVNPAHVEQLAQMFPQLDRREIAWELQRNRGNMAATTERVLSGRGLERPPQSFQPPPSILNPNATSSSTSSTNPSTSTSTSSSSNTSTNPAYQNLITRYNLTSKVASQRGSPSSSSSSAAAAAAPPPPPTATTSTEQSESEQDSFRAGPGPNTAGKTWSSNKAERQRLLQERREQMILDARRKLLEKGRGA